jgi:hypothetical protein
MKHKLIKINKLQYIVVDETDVKTLPYKSWFFDTNSRLVGQYFQGDTDVCWRKITHSTQPLNTNFNDWLDVQTISLSEVGELIYGYTARSMTEKETIKNHFNNESSYIKGFNSHKNLVKNKLFTIEDMQKAIQMSRLISDGKESFDAEDISGCTEVCTYDWKFKHNDYDIIQSLLPKTEWNVEFDENGKLKLIDK